MITLAGHFSGDETTVDPMNIYQLTNNSTPAEAFADYGWVTMSMAQGLGGGGFPGAMFDRALVADPYMGINTKKGKNGTYEFGATELVKTMQELIPSEADFSMTATWADACLLYTSKSLERGVKNLTKFFLFELSNK